MHIRVFYLYLNFFWKLFIIAGLCVSEIRELCIDHKRMKNIETQSCFVAQTNYLESSYSLLTQTQQFYEVRGRGSIKKKEKKPAVNSTS